MKRHQDREKSSKLPDPLRSKAEEVWSGNETITIMASNTELTMDHDREIAEFISPSR